MFQPDVIIDVKLGYLFKLSLAIEKVQIFDKVRLVDFLMHRESGKSQLLSVLLQVISPVEDSDSEAVHLPVLETIFDMVSLISTKFPSNVILCFRSTTSTSKSWITIY